MASILINDGKPTIIIKHDDCGELGQLLVQNVLKELNLYTEKVIFGEAIKETILSGSILCSALEVERTLLLRLEYT